MISAPAPTITPTGEFRLLPSATSIPSQFMRPHAAGKFLFCGEEKFIVRGVTYGTFRTDQSGSEIYQPDVVDRDFRAMALNGFNAVRTYTLPPRWCLDLAQSHGLRLLVGLPWEEHITFLDSLSTRRSIEHRVRTMVDASAGHPAIFAYAVGNEIPASCVRWHGLSDVERFIEKLCGAVKAEDPTALVTYVNYPSTEYLSLPAVDLFCFNVYLESDAAFRSYVARLHNLAGDRPLLMGEIGLDSLRHGPLEQARSLKRQARAVSSSGCAGGFVFSWTDEWYRGGREIVDWAFGLTTRDRQPKPALYAVRDAFRHFPVMDDTELYLPRVSVVVCTYNGARHLRQCLRELSHLDYPDYEVIVVNDGSTDKSAAIASEFDVRLINTPNCGLSNARNTGLRAATGEIIAYIDDDAYPDPQWLRYIVNTLQSSTHVAAGGPNIPPPGASLVSTSVSHSPGGPLHILLTDEIAEHIPGCNMAFWKKRLAAIGGFDPQFRVAGDDVDVCWRLQEKGWTIAYSPSAVVWHHRRSSAQAYLKQQLGYGKAEALLERKWPEKYNAAGHVQWSGRIYGLGRTGLLARQRIYYGFGGFAPFQLLYETPTLVSGSLSALPEWWFLILATSFVASLGFLWTPLLWLWPVLALALGAMFSQAFISACRSSCTLRFHEPSDRLLFVALTSTFHVLQPLARLVGRVRYGLTAWRYPGLGSAILPRVENRSIWSETWRSHADYLYHIEELIRNFRCVTVRGGNYDRWDLEVKGGLLGATRSLLLVEEHGEGRQFIKVKTWPTVGLLGIIPSLIFALLALGAVLDHAPLVSAIFGVVTLLLIGRTARECSSSQAVFQNVFAQIEKSQQGTAEDSPLDTKGATETQRYLNFSPQSACVSQAPRTVAP